MGVALVFFVFSLVAATSSRYTLAVFDEMTPVNFLISLFPSSIPLPGFCGLLVNGGSTQRERFTPTRLQNDATGHWLHMGEVGLQQCWPKATSMGL